MIEIGRHLSRKLIVERFPTYAAPTNRQGEFTEVIVNLNLESVRGCDHQRRLYRPGERRCGHCGDRMIRKVGCRFLGLSLTVAAQAELLEVGVHDVARVLDLTMADQVHSACHGQ